jgi:hypothetical protein
VNSRLVLIPGRPSLATLGNSSDNRKSHSLTSLNCCANSGVWRELTYRMGIRTFGRHDPQRMIWRSPLPSPPSSSLGCRNILSCLASGCQNRRYRAYGAPMYWTTGECRCRLVPSIRGASRLGQRANACRKTNTQAWTPRLYEELSCMETLKGKSVRPRVEQNKNFHVG